VLSRDTAGIDSVAVEGASSDLSPLPVEKQKALQSLGIIEGIPLA